MNYHPIRIENHTINDIDTVPVSEETAWAVVQRLWHLFRDDQSKVEGMKFFEYTFDMDTLAASYVPGNNLGAEGDSDTERFFVLDYCRLQATDRYMALIREGGSNIALLRGSANSDDAFSAEYSEIFSTASEEEAQALLSALNTYTQGDKNGWA